MAWLSGWGYRYKWTIDNTNVDSNQTDFRIKLHIDAAAGIGGVDVSKIFDVMTADANRKKIAVTSSDEVTELSVAIERWDDANEKAVLIVKVPSVTAGAATVLYFYFDPSHAENTDKVDDITVPGNTKDVIAAVEVDAFWCFGESLKNIAYPANHADFSTESAPAFTGSGLDDMSTPAGGFYSGDLIAQSYRVKIDGTGTPDTFTYSDDGGSSWVAAGIAITAGTIHLNNDVEVTFAATTGHTVDDYWDFTAAYVSVDLTNSPTTIAGVGSGRALSFDGVDQFADMNGAGIVPYPNPGDTYSIMAVIKTPEDGNVISGFWAPGGTAVDYQISIVGGFVDFKRSDGGGSSEGFADTVTQVDDDAWHTIAFVNHANNDHRIFVDGVLKTTDTTVWSDTCSIYGSMYFATDQNGSSYHNIDIAEIEIDDSNVSDDFIKAWHYSIVDAIGTFSDPEIEDALTEDIAMTDTFLDEHYSEFLTEALGMGFTLAVGAEYEPVLIEAVTMGDTIENLAEYFGSLTEDIEVTDTLEVVNWTQWLALNEIFSVNRYYLTLTGDGESTPVADLTLPMKSFSLRAKKDVDDNVFYSLTAYIPTLEYAAQIAARTNGDLIITMTYEIDDVIEQTIQLTRVDYDSVNTFEGSVNKSVALLGSRTILGSTQLNPLADATYENVTDGDQRFRFAKPDFFLRSGDTVTVNGGTEFIVGEIVYSISVDDQSMEITEGDGVPATTPLFTLNPNDKGPGCILSNNNLTFADSGGTYDSARSTAGYSTGKYYLEVTIGNQSSINLFTAVGIADITTPLTQLPGFTVGADSIGFRCTNEMRVMKNSVIILDTDLPDSDTDDIIMMAVDIGAQKAWWGREGTWADSGDPGAGTNPNISAFTAATYYACMGNKDVTSTVNFGASAFAYTPPAGFSQWDPRGVN